MQHGLLVASSSDEVSPRLLLAKIDEEILFDQRTYYLGTNEYRDGTINPAGFVHLESFRLDEGFPNFTYRIGGIDGLLLEKRIWMAWKRNTTYIQYRVLRTHTPEGQLHKNNFSNGFDRNVRLNNGRSYQEHADGDQQSSHLHYYHLLHIVFITNINMVTMNGIFRYKRTRLKIFLLKLRNSIVAMLMTRLLVVRFEPGMMRNPIIFSR